MTPARDLADQLVAQGMRAYREKRWDQAARKFTEARDAFRSLGETAAAAESANNLSVALLQAGRGPEALAAVRGTERELEQLGNPFLAAQAWGNLAAALEATGDLAGAERAYQEAADRFRSLDDAENRSRCLQALSSIRLRQRRPLESLSAMESALASRGRLSWGQRLLKWLLAAATRLIGRQ